MQSLTLPNLEQLFIFYSKFVFNFYSFCIQFVFDFQIACKYLLRIFCKIQKLIDSLYVLSDSIKPKTGCLIYDELLES